MNKRSLNSFFLALLILSILGLPARAEFREAIRIVGSSTVFPFTAYVAEKYYRKFNQPSPVVESTGTGGGIKMFCAGIGETFPDIVNASRRMKVSEINQCAQNRVKEITEVQIGWDGIILAKSRKGQAFNLTRKQLWKALARQLPFDGQLVNNPHTYWSDIDPGLPQTEIQVFGPPPTSGTRDVFIEEVMNEGCRFEKLFEAMDEKTRLAACGQIREDGRFIEAGEDDDLIIRRLTSNPKALGIIGYNVLERRGNLITALSVEGIEASFETIRDEVYPLTRPLFLYVKNEHKVALPQIGTFLSEFISPDAIGEEGYLTDKGLIPLKDQSGHAMQAQKLLLTTQ